MTTKPTAPDSLASFHDKEAAFYARLLRLAVGFFLVTTVAGFWTINYVHALKDHELALRIFLGVFFGFAITLITFLAIVIVKAFAETFFAGRHGWFYLKMFLAVVTANILVDVPIYLLLERYHFIPKEDLISKSLLAASFGGCLIFLTFIACVAMAVIIGVELKKTKE